MAKSCDHAVLGNDGGQRAAAFVLACMKRAAGVTDRLPHVPSDLHEGVFHVARLNKLVGLVDNQAGGNFPPSVFERYRQRMINLNGAVIKETIALDALLSEARIPHVILKGPLQQKILHGTPFFKPSGDIDILVGRQDFRWARQLFEALGYASEADTLWWRSFLGEVHLIRPGNTPKLDLHHRVHQPGIPHIIEAEAFLQEVSRVSIGGAELPVLDVSRAALLTAISIAKAFLGRKACADYVFDFQAHLSRMDDASVVRLEHEARRHGLYGTLMFASQVTSATIGSVDPWKAHSTSLPGLSAKAIPRFIVTPWLDDLVWPRRRDVLGILCAGRPYRQLPELVWLGAGEVVRRLTERESPAVVAVAQAPVGSAPAMPKDRSVSNVTVVIAARNASATIRRAIQSVLPEPEVSEIVVVDDASTDQTSAAVASLCVSDERLRLIRLDVNRGPSFARNRAFEVAGSDLVSILDADDFVLPGRYARMLATAEWDLVADNIVFVDHDSDHSRLKPSVAAESDTEWLDLAAFVAGNISRRGVHRGELGFLKPVMRLDFLRARGLRYDEDIRLGEDYDLYTRALSAGAKFKVDRSCGYAAVVYPASLSSSHRTDDLRRLADVDRRLLESLPVGHGASSAIARHERQTRDKYHLREFLDRKAHGLSRGISYAFSGPDVLRAVLAGVIADKAGHAAHYARTAVGIETQAVLPRYLLPLPMKGSA